MKKYLLQFASGEGLKWVDATKARHEAYAVQNGFEYVLATKPQTGLMANWERYPAMLDLWKKDPDALILYIDSDCCIATDEDITPVMPDWSKIMLLCENSGWWRSGVILARGCGANEVMMARMIQEGVVDARKPYDDEGRLNKLIPEIGIKPFPMPACWNRLAAHAPEHVPSDYPEMKIATLHGATRLIKLAFMRAWAAGYKLYDPKASEGNAPKPEDLCFYMRAYDDLDLADRALGYLRAAYPASEVQFVDDGTKDPAFDAIAKKHGVTLFREEKMYGPLTQGPMWHRNLERFLSGSSAKWLVKIDTDSLVLRPFRRALNDGSMSGVVMNFDSLPTFVQGGCIIIPREIAKIVFTSNILLDKKYVGLQWTREDGAHICEDLVISAAMRDSGVRLVSNFEANVAVVHPAK